MKVCVDPARVITHKEVSYKRKRCLEPMCPTCEASEEHPYRLDRILVRAYKFSDSKGVWSQCLVCSGYYDADLNEQEAKHDSNKGWFTGGLQ